MLRQFGRGRAARTFYVRFGGRSLVLKKELPDGQLPPGAVSREYR